MLDAYDTMSSEIKVLRAVIALSPGERNILVSQFLGDEMVQEQQVAAPTPEHLVAILETYQRAREVSEINTEDNITSLGNISLSATALASLKMDTIDLSSCITPQLVKEELAHLWYHNLSEEGDHLEYAPVKSPSSKNTPKTFVSGLGVVSQTDDEKKAKPSEILDISTEECKASQQEESGKVSLNVRSEPIANEATGAMVSGDQLKTKQVSSKVSETVKLDKDLNVSSEIAQHVKEESPNELSLVPSPVKFKCLQSDHPKETMSILETSATLETVDIPNIKEDTETAVEIPKMQTSPLSKALSTGSEILKKIEDDSNKLSVLNSKVVETSVAEPLRKPQEAVSVKQSPVVLETNQDVIKPIVEKEENVALLINEVVRLSKPSKSGFTIVNEPKDKGLKLMSKDTKFIEKEETAENLQHGDVDVNVEECPIVSKSVQSIPEKVTAETAETISGKNESSSIPSSGTFESKQHTIVKEISLSTSELSSIPADSVPLINVSPKVIENPSLVSKNDYVLEQDSKFYEIAQGPVRTVEKATETGGENAMMKISETIIQNAAPFDEAAPASLIASTSIVDFLQPIVSSVDLELECVKGVKPSIEDGGTAKPLTPSKAIPLSVAKITPDESNVASLHQELDAKKAVINPNEQAVVIKKISPVLDFVKELSPKTKEVEKPSCGVNDVSVIDLREDIVLETEIEKESFSKPILAKADIKVIENEVTKEHINIAPENVESIPHEKKNQLTSGMEIESNNVVKTIEHPNVVEQTFENVQHKTPIENAGDVTLEIVGKQGRLEEDRITVENIKDSFPDFSPLKTQASLKKESEDKQLISHSIDYSLFQDKTNLIQPDTKEMSSVAAKIHGQKEALLFETLGHLQSTETQDHSKSLSPATFEKKIHELHSLACRSEETLSTAKSFEAEDDTKSDTTLATQVVEIPSLKVTMETTKDSVLGLHVMAHEERAKLSNFDAIKEIQMITNPSIENTVTPDGPGNSFGNQADAQLEETHVAIQNAITVACDVVDRATNTGFTKEVLPAIVQPSFNVEELQVIS